MDAGSDLSSAVKGSVIDVEVVSSGLVFHSLLFLTMCSSLACLTCKNCCIVCVKRMQKWKQDALACAVGLRSIQWLRDCMCVLHGGKNSVSWLRFQW